MIILPTKLNVDNLYQIINFFGRSFGQERKNLENQVFDSFQVRNVDILGVLLFYKWTEYSVKNRCYDSPRMLADGGGILHQSICRFGFLDLMEAYYNSSKTSPLLQELKIELVDQQLIVPHALVRNKLSSKSNFDVDIDDKLGDYYIDLPTYVKDSLLQCTSEISSNFYSHADSDTETIILALASKNSYEVACADTSYGIQNSFRNAGLFNDKSDEYILQESVKRKVTSKPGTAHMGHGLWILDSMVSRYNGTLILISDGTLYENKNNKKRCVAFPSWKGTVVYFKLKPQSNLDLSIILEENRRFSDYLPKLNII